MVWPQIGLAATKASREALPSFALDQKFVEKLGQLIPHRFVVSALEQKTLIIGLEGFFLPLQHVQRCSLAKVAFRPVRFHLDGLFRIVQCLREVSAFKKSVRSIAQDKMVLRICKSDKFHVNNVVRSAFKRDLNQLKFKIFSDISNFDQKSTRIILTQFYCLGVHLDCLRYLSLLKEAVALGSQPDEDELLAPVLLTEVFHQDVGARALDVVAAVIRPTLPAHRMVPLVLPQAARADRVAAG